MRRTLALIATLTIAIASSAVAAPCRDAHGRFMKCHPMMAPNHCRDMHGRFAKCGMPGTHPA